MAEGKFKDLGIGSASAQTARMLNKDGTFNVERRGLGFFQSLSLYHTFLTMSWWEFNAMILTIYIVVNVIFASLYMLAGLEHLAGIDGHTFFQKFFEAFFFSTQTFTTVGYGRINPVGFAANSIAAIESITGLLAFALATGLLYGRFSRPNAKFLFSHHALVAPYQNITGWMFRVANQRKNQMIDVEALVTFSFVELVNGKPERRFIPLDLEREKVSFFHLSWTVVHPIDEKSPLWKKTAEDLRSGDAEFLIMLKGFDDTFSQTVNARMSYKYNEVQFDKRFSRIIRIGDNGKALIELHKLHDYVDA